MGSDVSLRGEPPGRQGEQSHSLSREQEVPRPIVRQRPGTESGSLESERNVGSEGRLPIRRDHGSQAFDHNSQLTLHITTQCVRAGMRSCKHM